MVPGKFLFFAVTIKIFLTQRKTIWQELNKFKRFKICVHISMSRKRLKAMQLQIL